MAGIIGLFEAHGVLSVFVGVLIEQLGAPIPAVPFLLLAGARSAADGLFALEALSAAAAACVIADTLWFLAGRRYGRSVLGLLCRVSLSPTTCVQKSEMNFARRGVLTILFAKFIPGVSTLTSPMAGALRMPLPTFILVDLAGTILWAGSGLAGGLVFHSQVRALIQALADLGSAAAGVLSAILALYVSWRALRRFLVHRKLRKAPRVTPGDLAAMLARGERLLLLDVRSGSLPPEARIPGAVPAPLDEPIVQFANGLSANVRIVTYCDCPNDASAARAAERLVSLGYTAHVLDGGFGAWSAAGFAVQPEAEEMQAEPHLVPEWKRSGAELRSATPVLEGATPSE